MYSKFLMVKNSEIILFLDLAEYNLIMWLMRLSKNFEKIAISVLPEGEKLLGCQ